MDHTGPTIRGFIQTTIAWNHIEIPSNVKKGVCQRFLWLVPKLTTVPFEKLQQVNQDLATSIGISIQ